MALMRLSPAAGVSRRRTISSNGPRATIAAASLFAVCKSMKPGLRRCPAPCCVSTGRCQCLNWRQKSWLRSRLQNKRALAGLDDADHRIVHRRRHTERLAEPRDRSVDSIDLAAPAGVVVEQHRWPRAGNLAAEFSDVLDRITHIQLHARRLGDGDGFLGAAPRDGPGIVILEDFA